MPCDWLERALRNEYEYRSFRVYFAMRQGYIVAVVLVGREGCLVGGGDVTVW